MRTFAALASLLLAACGEDTVEFPGDEVEPRWLLTADGESDGESVAILPDGSIVASIFVGPIGHQVALGGETYTLDGPGLLVLKLSSDDGSVLATAELQGTGSRSIATEDGDVVISALQGFSDSITRLSGDDLSVRWTRTLEITGDLAGARIAVDAAGDVIAAHANLERLHVEHLSGDDGVTTWTAEPLDCDSEATDVIAIPGGDVVVSGFCHLGDRFENVLLRLSSEDGAPVWQQDDVDLGDDSVTDALGMTDDGDLLVGSSTPLMPGSFDVETYASRVDLDGEVVWSHDICASGSCYGSWPFSMLLRGPTAFMTVFDLDTDIVVQSFSPDDGEVEPAITIRSSETNDVLNGAALDAQGRAVLTGTTGWTSQDDERGYAFVLAL